MSPTTMNKNRFIKNYADFADDRSFSSFLLCAFRALCGLFAQEEIN